MADYLTDPNYASITEIPSNVDLDCALENVTLYEKVISVVILERNRLNFDNPDIVDCHSCFSHNTLPYLLIEGLGTQTVLDFLTDMWEDVLSENLNELKSLLMPVADLLNEEQLNLAYKRLHNLCDLIQSLKQNKLI